MNLIYYSLCLYVKAVVSELGVYFSTLWIKRNHDSYFYVFVRAALKKKKVIKKYKRRII